MSGGGDKPTVSSTELPGWMQPYAKDYLGRASSVSSKPYEAYGGQTVASMDPRTQQGIDMQAQLGQSGTQAGNAGTGLLTDTLNGKFMGANSNPYLSGQIDRAQGDVIRNYNTVAKPQMESAMVGSGSFGNSGLVELQRNQQSDLQRNLGDISTQMRGNAYGLERGYQQQALGLAPQYSGMQFGNAQAMQEAGAMSQYQKQSELDDAYRRYMMAQGYDERQLGVLGGALGSLRGGVTTQTGGGMGISPGAGALGGAATGAYIGSVVPGIGTGIGAAAGGLLGYFGSRG